MAFGVYKNTKKGYGLSNDVVSSIIEDKKQNLWIGTDGGGLNYLDRQTGTFTYYQNKANNPHSLSSNMVKVIYRDREDNIWIGTYGGDLNLLNRIDNTFTHHYIQSLQPNANVTGSEISAALEDSYGRLWVGSSLGLGILEKNAKGYNAFVTPSPPEYRLHSGRVKYLFEDDQKNLWVGTINGLTVFWDKQKRNQLFLKNNKNSDSLQSDNINCIHQDSRGNIWIGTYDGGLSRYNHATQTFTTYTEKDGLPDNSIIGILEDDKGNLWLSTGNGLCCFNPVKKSFSTYTYIDGLASNEFNYNAFFKDSRGEMFFGGYNGLTYFYPDNIKANSYSAPVVFTALRLFNQPVEINGNDGLLKKDISLTNEITFNHNQNIFTVEFAILNFEKSNKNKYAYKLDGFEKNWNYVNTPSATYTNLAPGNYTLLVKGANNDGVWSPLIAQLQIKIRPPFWLTWWAFIIYIILLTAILFFVARFFFLRELLKKEDELHQVKLNFFTNISHEIRTNLTLIMAPLEKIQQTEDEKGIFHEQAKKADHNASRLQKLVNELMDFRKAETNHLELYIGEYNLIAFLQEIYDNFFEVFQAKNVSLEFEHQTDILLLYFDKDQLEKVFFNLLTNALKFTDSGGCVRLIVELEPEKVYVKVKDDGIGIAPEHLKNLFNNFFQVADYGTQNTGYGIGLALSKNIAELHKGSITVSSIQAGESNKSETSFTVTLLRGSKHFEKSVHTHPINTKTDETTVGNARVKPLFLTSDEHPAEIILNKHAQFTILTAEDNVELRQLIRDTLGSQYHVLECENGLQALALATEQIPDLIISDVLMPQMDGFSLCNSLKTDERTSHIPVILLTAKSSQADQITGLETGADVYLFKPFSTRALQLNIRNLLASREKMREKIRRQFTTLQARDETSVTNNGKEEENGLGSIDNAFIEKVVKLIYEHMYDPDFSASTLSSKIEMNQAVLFKKIKAITNLSLNDFIKSNRLKRAAQLLSEGELKVSDVAFIVGYHDRRYFSREFRKQFGKLPKEYANGLDDEDD